MSLKRVTRVNSSLAKTVIPSEDSLAKVTYYKLDLDTILDGLIPDPLPVSGGKDNAIHHLNIIIFGKPNTGKSTFIGIDCSSASKKIRAGECEGASID
jgi:hypothetical protein